MYFSAHSKPQPVSQEALEEIRDQVKVTNKLIQSGLNVPDELSDVLNDVQSEAQEV